MEPASITKLMTCLLAAERLDLDQEIEITKEATDVIPTKMYLQVGGKDNSRGTALCGAPSVRQRCGQCPGYSGSGVDRRLRSFDERESGGPWMFFY